MRKMLVLLIAVVLFCGCAKLAHLQELLTLKSLSANQAAQEKYIEEQNKKFESLLDVVRNNKISEYPDKKSFLKMFGEPILTKIVQKNGQEFERWLYRYPAKLQGSEKVYLYFDSSEKLVSWEHVDSKDQILRKEGNDETIQKTQI